MERYEKSIVVIGNGPSLRNFDWLSISSVHTLGMNAAYRYWERINWYPDHYACIDDQLIETHHNEIYRLVKEGRVKTAFVLAKILDYHPELLTLDNVFYLESFHNVRWKRCQDYHKIPRIQAKEFRESDPSKVTTGAYSIRFAAFIGYTEITTLGIDLKYKEIIPEAKRGSDIKLEIVETPKVNPNYFFDDYQQKGDKYNVPNPAVHKGNLHVRSLELVANDLVQFQWNARVRNSNKASAIYEGQIFPFVDIGTFTGNANILSAVVIPATVREIEDIKRAFQMWDRPRLSPVVGILSQAKPKLVLCFPLEISIAQKDEITASFESTAIAKSGFSSIEIRDAGVAAEDNYYQRDYTRKVSGKGYKAGPNEQFFGSMKALADLQGFIFYMETDCFPLYQGWINTLCESVRGDYESWIIGCCYRGISEMNPKYFLHLNGNALYRVGDAAFQSFVVDVWQPLLHKEISKGNATLAYDCLLSYVFTTDSANPQSPNWLLFQQFSSRFRFTELLQNISAKPDLAQDPYEWLDRIYMESPRTTFIHGRHFFKALMKEPQTPITSRPAYEQRAGEKYPRLLMIDSTPIGHSSATGHLKQVFLGDWPKDSFLQVWGTSAKETSLHTIQIGESIKESNSNVLDIDAIIGKCKAFTPDVIYFRPVDTPVFLELAQRLTEILDVPLVIHTMDDWPERLRRANSADYTRLNAALQKLVNKASVHLSICDAMSAAYKKRYGKDWVAIANGVTLKDFQPKDWDKKGQVSAASPFIIRYMGALAEDMTYESVRDVALTVAALQADYAVRFEIYTMNWCRPKADSELGILPGVFIHDALSPKPYRESLCGADATVIAYNFDETSIAYTGLSLANKMPECFASGAPLLAYGPPEVATIDYLKKAGCAQVVDTHNTEALRSAIVALITQPDHCKSLSIKARSFARQNLTKKMVEGKFYRAITRAADSARSQQQNSNIVIGPFNRAEAAHYDETDCVAEIFSTTLSGKQMIDVGAHHGWALAPFLEKSWNIYAFEPDEKNRARLLDRLRNHKNKNLVSLDIRCVSNKSQKGISFYRSEQSTGISGLSAFHESHVEAQQVDTTTLDEFFGDKPLSQVDFLKVDTEGHDLFVLQGFPWERTRPAVIECEFEDTKTVPLGYTFHELAQFLIDKGYTVYVSEWHPIIRYGIRHDWKHLSRYPCQLSDEKAWGNLIAFRDPIDEDALKNAVRRVLTFGKEANAQSKASSQAKKSAFRVMSDSHFSKLSANQWRYTHSAAKQKLWQAVFSNVGVTKGCSFISSIRLSATQPMEVAVEIGRYGTSAYEGQLKIVTLKPREPQTIQVYKRFLKAHTRLKVQLDVLSLEGDHTADFTIESVNLFSALDIVHQPSFKADTTLVSGNRLLRQGNYVLALPIYLSLYRENALNIYRDNALMAARRLGIASVTSVPELLQIFGVNTSG